MKIKHFIVTYNNKDRINTSLDSLFSSGDMYNTEIYIISNHTILDIDSKFIDKVTILKNETRPNFSTGHLSRNWNQAIINGFQNLNYPDCDILITSQDDTIFRKNYIEKSISFTQNYDFLTFGAGDQYSIYTPLSIKRIGLWDERLCNIGHQEADFFLRAIKYYPLKVSINDYVHGRLHNIQRDSPIYRTPTGAELFDPNHLNSIIYHPHSEYIFYTKWNVRPHKWDEQYIKNLDYIEPQIPSFIMYPYFEKDIEIETLRQQKFIINENIISS